jgi:hypothetical protein
MAAAPYVRQKQRVVGEFLCCGNMTVRNIHKRLKSVHGDDPMVHSGCMNIPFK